MKENNKTIKLIEKAKILIGKNYKYGASLDEAPELFDCSSFIQFIFKQTGIKMPRSAIEQIEKGISVDIDELQAGDLIFLKGSKFHVNEKWPDGVGHVALYIGDGKIIHAEGSKHKKVVLENLEDLNLKELRAVKRIL